MFSYLKINDKCVIFCLWLLFLVYLTYIVNPRTEVDTKLWILCTIIAHMHNAINKCESFAISQLNSIPIIGYQTRFRIEAIHWGP